MKNFSFQVFTSEAMHHLLFLPWVGEGGGCPTFIFKPLFWPKRPPLPGVSLAKGKKKKSKVYISHHFSRLTPSCISSKTNLCHTVSPPQNRPKWSLLKMRKTRLLNRGQFSSGVTSRKTRDARRKANNCSLGKQTQWTPLSEGNRKIWLVDRAIIRCC